MVRLSLTLAETSQWLKLFDPRGGGLFVPTREPPAVGSEVRIDLVITSGGPRVILKGTVLWRRAEAESRDPPGCVVGLAQEEREKINFINGFVRGGLINRRERRRLPLRLRVVCRAGDDERASVTRDVNEEGLFVITERPFAEDTEVALELSLPGRDGPLALRGVVGHTVIPEDEDLPGMGIRFVFGEAEQREVVEAVDALEQAFYKGQLPDEIIT